MYIVFTAERVEDYWEKIPVVEYITKYISYHFNYFYNPRYKNNTYCKTKEYAYYK